MKRVTEEKKERAITKTELNNMLTKYNIGKKPLANLLGWGETTIVLYTSFDEVPDGEYAKKLYSLYKNPGVYLKLLEERGSVLTDVAYRKTFNAVKQAVFSEDIFLMAQYVINRTGTNISLARLSAILLFSQIMSLSLDDVPLFEDDFRPDSLHLPYGKLTERFVDEGCFCIELGKNVISERAEYILDVVTDAFAWYGPKAIEAILKAEHMRFCGAGDNRIRRQASKEMLKKCYKGLFEQNHVAIPGDFTLYLHKRMTALRKQEKKLE